MSAASPTRARWRVRATTRSAARSARRWSAFAGAIGFAAALAGAGTVAAQDATNSLQSIVPENGSSVAVAPAAIVLTFNQEIDDSEVLVLTIQCGGQVQSLGPLEYDDDRLVATFRVLTPLPKGVCFMTWRLADAENTTIASGDSSFGIDSDPAPTTTTTVPGAPAVTQVTVSPPTDDSVAAPREGSSGGPLWLGRLLSTLGIMALFGGLALIALGWPEGPEYVVTVRYLRTVWVVAMVGTLLFLVAYASDENGVSFGAAASPGQWLDLQNAGAPGWGALLRLVAVAGAGWVAMRPERIIDPTTSMYAWGLPGLALLAVALSRVDGPVAWFGVLVELGHVAAAAMWFGGVGLVARVVLAGPGEEDLVHATRAFGRISTKAIAVAVATGVVQMWRLVGNPFGSDHGRVLLLKVVAVVALVLLAVGARQQLALRLDRAQEMTVPLAARFRRAFSAEVAIGIVIMMFSAWMLGLTPANVDPLGDEEYTQTIPFNDEATGLRATVFIGPARVGANGFKIEVDAPQEGITNLDLRFLPPIGSGQPVLFVDIPLSTAGTVILDDAIGLPFNVAGDWTLELIAATATASQPGARFTFRVAGADGSVVTVPQVTVPVPVSVTSVTTPTNTADFATTTPAPQTTTTTAAPSG